MSQSDNKKSTPSTNEKSTPRPSEEIKLEGGQKAKIQKPRVSVLPPEDYRLRLMIVADRMPEPITLLAKVKMFFARLFGR